MTALSHTATGPRPIGLPRAGMPRSPRMARASICCLAVAPTISGRASGQRRRAVRWRTASMRQHGLADEVLLVVYPVLLGTGKRFFADGTPPRSFELISTQA